MSEKDKVFCFVEGLKTWDKTKLYEQRFKAFQKPTLQQNGCLIPTTIWPKNKEGAKPPLMGATNQPKPTLPRVVVGTRPEGQIVNSFSQGADIKGTQRINTRIVIKGDSSLDFCARGPIECLNARTKPPLKPSKLRWRIARNPTGKLLRWTHQQKKARRTHA